MEARVSRGATAFSPQVLNPPAPNPVPHATGLSSPLLSFLFSISDLSFLPAYSKGGPLAVTDANLLLGRLIPHYFPHIFGPTEDQPLDIEASRSAFEELRKTINEETGKNLGLDEIVYGFIKVANETMARPIRALTEARGYATGKHMCVYLRT